MNVNSFSSINPSSYSATAGAATVHPPVADAKGGELRETFQQFVGQAFFGEMLSAMRKTQGETPYFNGGRGEEVFRQQLDQVLAEKMSRSTSDSFTGPMYELFMLSRS